MLQLKIADKFQKIIQDFIKELKSIYGTNIASIVLYGSAASGEFIDKHSNINLLVVLNSADLSNLKKVSPIVKKHKFNILNTLFLTLDYIKSSTDVFPIEFLDMKDNYVVLFGEDILKDLQIDLKNLRFQCEQELKSRLINIKRLYLKTQNKNALITLLLKSSNSVMHILRNLLRLKGKVPPYLKEEMLKEISQEFLIDTNIFNRILEVKKSNLRLSFQEIEKLLFAFVNELGKIIAIVDGL